MSPKKVRKVVVYVRISVSREESVSLARQEESARAYAASKGWEVVCVFTDDGVSATANRPQDRQGWKAMLATPGWDAVIIWKIDRLARRITDFWGACQQLQDQGRVLVSVEDSLDMTTAMGRTMAGLIAGFAEMEAEAISVRVTAARKHLLANGRYPGGRIPYGWQKAPHPDGAGWTVVQDPERVRWVEAMVERTQAGRSIYSTAAWLNEQGAPTVGGGAWKPNTVENLLRHPILAGLTPAGGEAPKKKNGEDQVNRRGVDVLRGPDGLPLVDEGLAIMTLGAWRAMIASLDEPQDGRRMPVALRTKTSGVLSGLVWCADERHPEPVRMWRGTSAAGPAYQCGECFQTLSNAEGLITSEALQTWGASVMWSTVEEVHEGAAALLPEIEHRLDELDGLIRGAASREDRAELQAQQAALLDQRDEARATPGRVSVVETGPVRPVAEAWESAEDDEQRHDVMAYCLDRVLVRRGGRGHWTEAQKRARMTFEWHPRMGAAQAGQA